MYQELELVREIDILSVDSNDNENDSDKCSIFGRTQVNTLVQTGQTIAFDEVYGSIEWINN